MRFGVPHVSVFTHKNEVSANPVGGQLPDKPSMLFELLTLDIIPILKEKWEKIWFIWEQM